MSVTQDEGDTWDTRFDWDEGNLDHIAAHGVEPDEAEDVFADPDRVGVGTYNTATERRAGLVGRTSDGRLLMVVFTTRRGAIRVVTALDATDSQQRSYRRRTRQGR